LEKKGKYGLGTKKKRYFVLAGEILLYYLNKNAYSAKQDQKGAIVLRQSKTTVEGKNLAVELPYRTYQLNATTPEEATEWCTALREAHERILRQEKERPRVKAKLAAASVLNGVRQEKLKKELVDKDESLSTTSKALDATKSDLRAANKSIQELQSDLESKRGQIKTLHADLEQSRVNGEKLAEELGVTKAKVSELDSTIKSHDRTNTLKLAIARTITDTHDHKAEKVIQELTEQNEKLLKDLEGTHAEIASLKQVVATKIETIGRVKANGEITRLRLGQTQLKLDAAKQDIIHFTYQLNDTTYTLDQTKTALSSTEIQLGATQTTLESTEQELSDAKENALGAAEFIREIQNFVANTSKSALKTLNPPTVVVESSDADGNDAEKPESKEAGNAAYTFCNICPTFTVLDWEAAEPIMEEFVELTKTEKGCMYYGWTRTGDTLKCREAYVDAEAVNAHLANVGDLIGRLLADGVAKLDAINIDCPAEGVDVVKPGTQSLGTEYFTIDDGFTNLKSVTGDLAQPYTFCSIHPTFTVIDWEKAKPVMSDFVRKTRTEAGCLYYGWTLTGNKLKCREGYFDGNSVNVHLANVGDAIKALLADGVATLDSIEIHGPSDQLEIVKPGTEALGTKYFAIDSGFSKFV
jgi:quinol monooxygenase YgiN/peptidoglycan hydrolase CwlO-like protein